MNQLKLLLENQQAAWLKSLPRTYQARVNDLKILEQMLRDNKDGLIAAMDEDFGHRSWHESLSSDLIVLLAEISHCRKKLRSWIRRRPVPVNWRLWPARAWIEYQPLGVVGVMAPWNYPVNLVMAPLAVALAAGNHVMAKPSEHTPRTSELMASLIADRFPVEQVHIVTGEIEVSKQFAALPFDHLLFTGSTEVGRKIMQAAAHNLTPVTLELGGKSPVIVDTDANLDRAAASIVRGKWFNAGQTCIAPDYVLVAGNRGAALAERIARHLRSAYPDFESNQDYTHIINLEQYQRLKNSLDEARTSSAQIIMPLGDTKQVGTRFDPTIVLDPEPGLALMREEIFGPILPILSTSSHATAVRFINQRPKPLALYYYGNIQRSQRTVLERTSAGGVCINDALIQFTEPALPFGGVGESGMGQYHGHDGFLAFSKKKPVVQQARWSAMNLLKPPYTGIVDRALRMLIR